MKKGTLLSTCLIGLSLLLFLGSTFCFFGHAIDFPGRESANMFAYMFGAASATNYQLKGLTWVFALQMIIIALIIFIIVCIAKKDSSTTLIMVIMLVVCLLSLIALILSFNTINFYLKVTTSTSAHDLSLGVGPITYSVLNIAGIVSSLLGIFFLRKGM